MRDPSLMPPMRSHMAVAGSYIARSRDAGSALQE